MSRALLALVVLCPLSLDAQMTLLSLEGRVFYRLPGTSAFQAAAPGALLPTGAVVRVGEGARAVLVGRSGRVVRLPEDTRFTVPVEEGDQPATLYTSTVNKAQSVQRSHVSMTQVAATRSQERTPPLQNAFLTEEDSQKLELGRHQIEQLELPDVEQALLIASLLEEFSQWAAAEAVYTQTLEAAPQRQDVLRALADLYYKRGKLTEAYEIRARLAQ